MVLHFGFYPTCAHANKVIQILTLNGIDTSIWKFFWVSSKGQLSIYMSCPMKLIHHLQSSYLNVTSFALSSCNAWTHCFLITIQENPEANLSFYCISYLNSHSIMHHNTQSLSSLETSVMMIWTIHVKPPTHENSWIFHSLFFFFLLEWWKFMDIYAKWNS